MLKKVDFRCHVGFVKGLSLFVAENPPDCVVPRTTSNGASWETRTLDGVWLVEFTATSGFSKVQSDSGGVQLWDDPDNHWLYGLRTSTCLPPMQLLILECHEQWLAKKKVSPPACRWFQGSMACGEEITLDADGQNWSSGFDKVCFRSKTWTKEDKIYSWRLFFQDSIMWTSAMVPFISGSIRSISFNDISWCWMTCVSDDMFLLGIIHQ